MNLRPSQPVGELLGPLAERIGARGVSHPETRVSGVTLRSQDVLPGDLFAALPGSSAHGARYAVDAVRAGAVAVLTDPAGASALELHPDVDVLVHPTPRAVLGEVAAAVYGHPSRRLRVVGVTGTSGKTTTTYLVEAGLRAAGRVAGLIGTVGIRIDGRDEPSALTTPEAPDLQALLAVMVERGVDTVVMEVSSHALTLGRVDGVVFEAGAFTNLSRDHLDFHPTMADYLNAKARLFERESPIHAAHAVVCVDDDAGRQIAARAESPVRISTTGGVADWGVEAVHAVGRGTQQFVAVDPAGVHHTLRIALPGRYNIANALLAVALLDVIGVSPEQSAPGLRGAAVPGRLQAVDGGQDFLALVDYAHKPGALEAVLQTLRGYGGQERSDQGIGTGGQERSDRGIGTGGQERSDQGIRTQGRLAVVFGAGGNRDAGKREPMGRIAAELADLVVVTDDNPRDEDPAVIRSAILAGAVDQPAEVVEIGDRRAAIEFAVGWARPGDVVLIAGKGHESGQTSGGQTRPFDDRTELAGALAALGHHP